MKKPLFETLTKPPPPRPPAPKEPLFTKNFFSTKSFGPGHIVGAGALVLGLYGLSKYFFGRGQAEAERTRKLAEQARMPAPRTANGRGQYGKLQEGRP